MWLIITWLILGIKFLTSCGSANQSFPPVNIAVGMASCVTLYGGGEGWGGGGGGKEGRRERYMEE